MQDPVNLLPHMIHQMLHSLQSTDEQVEKAVILKETFCQKFENIAFKGQIAGFEQFHL